MTKSNKIISFHLITPERTVFTEDVYEVVIPTFDGQLAILPSHIPLITLIKPGVLALRRLQQDTDASLEHVAISGGFAEITQNSVKILADTAERAEEIDELKAEEAKKRALELKDKARDDVALADATALLEKSLARLKLAGIKRRHRNR